MDILEHARGMLDASTAQGELMVKIAKEAIYEELVLRYQGARFGPTVDDRPYRSPVLAELLARTASPA
jgi:hypothetical protein